MTTAATCRRGLVFLFFVLMMVVVPMAATATAARLFNFLGLLRVTATAATHFFLFTFAQQGLDHFQHFVSFCSVGVAPITHWRSYH